jgi:hypothetical protein
MIQNPRRRRFRSDGKTPKARDMEKGLNCATPSGSNPHNPQIFLLRIISPHARTMVLGLQNPPSRSHRCMSEEFLSELRSKPHPELLLRACRGEKGASPPPPRCATVQPTSIASFCGTWREIQPAQLHSPPKMHLGVPPNRSLPGFNRQHRGWARVAFDHLRLDHRFHVHLVPVLGSLGQQ